MSIYTESEDRSMVSQSSFINSSDPEVSSLAVDLVNTRYTLSKIHSRYSVVVPEDEQLDTFVIRVLNELRLKIVIRKLEQLSIELRTAEQSGETEDNINKLLEELMRWNRVKAEYSKHLGVRTVL